MAENKRVSGNRTKNMNKRASGKPAVYAGEPGPRRQFLDYLSGYRIQPQKTLGQNFLYGEESLGRLIEALGLPEATTVLEIGAGTGNLTALLAERCRKVYALEIDRQLERPLRDRFPDPEKVELRFGDALACTDFSFLTDAEPLWVVGNLPYYISTKLMVHALLQLPQAAGYGFLLQKECLERVLAGPNTKDYGPLNILLATCTEPEAGPVLGTAVFYPAPAVQSQLLILRLSGLPAVFDVLPEPFDRGDFFSFLKQGFTQRRKLLTHSAARLAATWPKLQQFDWKNWLENRFGTTSIRPEQLAVSDWQALYLEAKR